MSKYRVLLDEKIEHHTRPLLNNVGIKADMVCLTTGNLTRLLQADPYDALIARERVRTPLEVMETALTGKQVEHPLFSYDVEQCHGLIF
ncbi:MAG: hypothetical protein KJO66_09080 [Gammaproteobacteria bacterium]|nr:hypothetical protein [Gammaproteobacteria bacterium]